jgi:2-methylisocitrate lyase-like PEP mutase family enzyme
MSGAGRATTRFRALHERAGIFVMPNPWDAGTARMLRHLGFEALATGSAPFAATLGRRDGEVAREEAVGHASMISAVTGLPVNGDLERGYGDRPEDVFETIRQAITAGLAGCSIEDATGQPAEPLYERALAVERIGAARSAIDEAGSDFVLTARCEAYLTGHEAPLVECLERLAEMAEAGADVVYACGMAAADDIAALVKEVPRPVNVLGGTGPEPLSVKALEDLGVKRVSLGPRLLQAAMGGFLRATRELKEEGTFGFMADAAQLGSVYGMFGGGDRR